MKGEMDKQEKKNGRQDMDHEIDKMISEDVKPPQIIVKGEAETGHRPVKSTRVSPV